MTKPTCFEVIEYAIEGLNTLIGVGSGYENEAVLEEYKKHRIWVEKELERLREKGDKQ